MPNPHVTVMRLVTGPGWALVASAATESLLGVPIMPENIAA